MYFLKIENTYDGLILPEEKHSAHERAQQPIMESGFPLSEGSLENHGGDLDLVPGKKRSLSGSQ